MGLIYGDTVVGNIRFVLLMSIRAIIDINGTGKGASSIDRYICTHTSR